MMYAEFQQRKQNNPPRRDPVYSNVTSNKANSIGKASVTYSELEKRDDYYDQLCEPADGHYQNLPQ